MANSPQPNIDRARLRIVLATIAVNLFGVSLLAFATWSDWRTGLALNLVDHAIVLPFVILRRDGLLARLLVFGIALGFAELAADAWLVDVTRTLDYSIGGGPMLWRSPLWMPFAWEMVAFQFGYIGLRLIERFRWTGVLLTGLLGAINIPFYEEMALRTRWWSYSTCRMLAHTPYYIIAGEFVICAAIGLLALALRRGGTARATLLGTAGGAIIFASYAAAYLLIDGLPRSA